MINRRESLKWFGAVSAASLFPLNAFTTDRKDPDHHFIYCLNTSTIRGQGQDLVKTIEIAAEAGYDGVELWVSDVRDYKDKGLSLTELRKIITSNSLSVEGAIGFASWIADDPDQRQAGFIQMEQDMNMMAELECKRIAAPPYGFSGQELDFLMAGERYREVLDLGRKTGVMPQLEFWGSSPVLHHLGQALYIAAAANDPDARILADVYHLFRGGSGFNGLKMLDGSRLELFHMNDYPGDIPVTQLKDSDRVYPGDGVAPMKEILTTLHRMGGAKVLSLELFNPSYWQEDALAVASRGLQKMKNLVQSSL
jgi:sugar phosphate isomerase/epimerase